VSIGGFSAGGSVAVSFAAYLVSQGGTSNPKSLFAIDPPLDLQRIYALSRRMRRYTCSSVAAEGQSTIAYLDKALGGSPDDQYANYVTFSPFMESESDGGNAKWLKQVPVRLYAEPDINFVKERHCAEMEPEDLNAVDLEKLSKRLKYAGNDHCEYVVTKGRGYHSWNIAEPAELAAWIVKFGSE
jgi:acetyl esterase/lipase